MNITMLRLKPLVAELRAIRLELTRMNDMKELELANGGLYVKPPVADMTGLDPEISYVDEERDAIREMEEAFGRVGKSTPTDNMKE